MPNTVGYIVVGPRDLPADRSPVYAAAINGARILRQAAEDYAEGREVSPEATAIVGNTGMDLDYDLEHYAHTTDADARAIVDALYSVWDLGAGDACSRVDPNDPERVIVFAGGSADNCDYESGKAYEALREADRVGALAALNIH